MMETCASCSLCCKLPRIPELSKPAGVPCSNLDPSCERCTIYADRPLVCQDFNCAWVDGRAGAEWRPVDSHMVVYQQFPNVLVLVDPDHPQSWEKEPYRSQMRQWSSRVAEMGGVVAVFVGEKRIQIAEGDR